METVTRTQKALEPLINAAPEYPPPWLKEHTPTELVEILNTSQEHISAFLSALNQNKKRKESLKSTLNRLDDRLWSLLEHLYDTSGEKDIIDLIENSSTTALYLAYSRSYKSPEEWVGFVKGTQDISLVPMPIIEVARTGTSYLAWEGLSGYPDEFPEYSEKPNPYGHLYSLYDLGVSNVRLTDEDKQNQLVLTVPMQELSTGENSADIKYSPDVVRTLIKQAA